MPRLKTIDPANAQGRAKEIFEGPLKGKFLNIFKAMANSPAALDVYLGMSGPLHKGLINDKELEMVQLAIAEATSCDYCVAAHTAIGKGAGLTDQQCLEARKGRSSDRKLDAVAKFAIALHEKKGAVSDQDLAAIRAAGYGDGHIAEFVAAYALAIYTTYFNHVNHTAVDFPAVPKV